MTVREWLEEYVVYYVRWWWHVAFGVRVRCSGGCGKVKWSGGWLDPLRKKGALLEWECARCYCLRWTGSELPRESWERW